MGMVIIYGEIKSGLKKTTVNFDKPIFKVYNCGDPKWNSKAEFFAPHLLSARSDRNFM